MDHVIVLRPFSRSARGPAIGGVYRLPLMSVFHSHRVSIAILNRLSDRRKNTDQSRVLTNGPFHSQSRCIDREGNRSPRVGDSSIVQSGYVRVNNAVSYRQNETPLSPFQECIMI